MINSLSLAVIKGKFTTNVEDLPSKSKIFLPNKSQKSSYLSDLGGSLDTT